MIRWLRWRYCVSVYVNEITEARETLRIQGLFSTHIAPDRGRALAQRWGFDPAVVEDAAWATFLGRSRRWRKRRGLRFFEAPQ